MLLLVSGAAGKERGCHVDTVHLHSSHQVTHTSTKKQQQSTRIPPEMYFIKVNIVSKYEINTEII